MSLQGEEGVAKLRRRKHTSWCQRRPVEKANEASSSFRREMLMSLASHHELCFLWQKISFNFSFWRLQREKKRD